MTSSKKALIIALKALIILLAFSMPAFAGVVEPAIPVIFWADLGIAKQIAIIAGLVLMFVILCIAIVIFRSVWIRQGYEGIDEKLEGKEVALMISHVFGFALLEVFVFMITFRAELSPPTLALWICGGGFLTPEVLMIVNMFKKTPKQPE